MNRILIFLGIILILVAIVLLVGTLASTEIEASNQIITSLVCEPDESLISITYYSGASSNSDTFYCETNEGVRRDVTLSIVGIAATAFLVPFLSGMFLTIFGAWRLQAKMTQQIMGSFTGQNGQVVSIGNGMITGATSQKSLVDRLQELEDTRKKGFITSAEYERTRQAILDSFDD